jgi:response regulator RpfG family c-di-GMP phosphodiesterase
MTDTQTEKILFVDDDSKVLASYRRGLRKEFAIETAVGSEEALALIEREGPFAVIVSDLRMPGADGIQLLAQVRQLAPDTVRIMLTGYSDVDAAIGAVNEGSVFRFLTKPCPPETMVAALTAAVGQYRLVTAERDLLQKTLRGSVRVLIDVLALVNPTAFGRAARVRQLARRLAEKLGSPVDWQLEVAAMLSQVGCVTLAQETLEKIYRGQPLSDAETRSFLDHPKAGHDLISNVPRLEPVAEIIKYQEKHYDGTGVPFDSRRGAELPLGSRILKIALDFDSLLSAGASSGKAVKEIGGRIGWYDPSLVAALTEIFKAEITHDIRSVRVDELAPGMILAQDVFTATGILLIPKGLEVTPTVRLRLANIVAKGGLVDLIRVLVLPERALAEVEGRAVPSVESA